MNVLITGAAGGLGRAFAVECAKRGYNLLLTDINEAGLLSIREGLERRYGSRVLIMPLDITQSAGLEKLFCFAREAGFRIDMLVNVAGGDAEGAFLERDGATIARLVRLNVVAALEATHSALEARNPDIPFYVVFVSSLASMYPMPYKAAYAASKRFLLDFSLALRQELADRNVHVTTLCPAGLATTRQAMAGMAVQGFMGSATANSLEIITKRTLDKVLRGRFLYIPGLINKLMYAASRFIPRPLIARLIHRRWGRARERAGAR
ncbi:MAG TPA: SDR family NAD(P)-dependent oxidoreductase [Clostridia bacterium]|nr:MAG: Serine 3-dehydrogenase [Firmicutes bacterium ADurb.Bin248]HOG01247.1 SDR family NAD(P)-dependent oxidoreductase [Clostridia bacterium]HOS17850.1 SDR family NAD(P)-dependent oxidoreductase [Clostridia bacterium]HPK16143.1 SDR family NAD(P)-dependent oxidoreductase [Clostridia bacterium]